MSPITQLMRAIMTDDKAKYEKTIPSLGFVLEGDK